MEKPTVEQIKKHFENAKEVRCLHGESVKNIGVIYDSFYDSGLWGQTPLDDEVWLYSPLYGYAEIISYHETEESKNINEINVIFDEVKENETPEYYDNSKGSLYRISEDRKWNSYQFDIIKRIDRSLKKGQFKEDLIKTKNLIDLWLKEHNENNLKQ